MAKERKLHFVFAGVIVMALIICGVVGYINRSGASLTDLARTQTALPAGTPVAELQYCVGSANLCVISFGLDNSENMLIVLRQIGAIQEIYAKVKQAGKDNLFACQKIEFSIDTYYCLGSAVPEKSDIVLEVYTKDGDILLASGKLSVQFSTTPVAITTKMPSATLSATIISSNIATPTLAAGQPNPTPYPNSTAYPNSTTYPKP